MNGVIFLRPVVLIVGLPLVLVTVVLYMLNYRARIGARARYGSEPLLSHFSKTISLRRERLIPIGWALAMALLVVAAAGLCIPDSPISVQQGTMHIVIVSDVSNSMRAEDYRADMPIKDGVPAESVQGPYGSRLDMVKSVIENQIMPAVSGNKIGIATYKGEGFAQANLTDDFLALKWVILHWFTVGDAPGQGSNVSAGLQTALAILEQDQTPGQQRVIVLFSDGGFTDAPENISAIEDKVRQAGVRFIVVGVGSTEPQQVPFWKDGEVTYATDENGQIITTSINETALRDLSNAMSGVYLRITDGALATNWALQLAGAGKTKQETADIFYLPLGLAVLILLGIRVRGIRVS